MDGSIKIIPSSEIKNIKVEDWEEVGNRQEGN